MRSNAGTDAVLDRKAKMTLHAPNMSLFFPEREGDRSNAVRLRQLIESHVRLNTEYGRAYGPVVEALRVVRDANHPAIAGMTDEQRADIEASLLSVRDEVARGFTQAIARVENDSNELAPGTFPRGDIPFQSFDLGEWLNEVLTGLIDILDGLATIFDAFGIEPVADVLHEASNALEYLQNVGVQHGWFPPPNDD